MALNVENLRVYYQTLHGDVQALEGVTFDVENGEIMGLAGESGCGKTTLGHSLIRLVPPMRFVEGKVVLDGEELPVWDTERMAGFRFKKISSKLSRSKAYVLYANKKCLKPTSLKSSHNCKASLMNYL